MGKEASRRAAANGSEPSQRSTPGTATEAAGPDLDHGDASSTGLLGKDVARPERGGARPEVDGALLEEDGARGSGEEAEGADEQDDGGKALLRRGTVSIGPQMIPGARSPEAQEVRAVGAVSQACRVDASVVVRYMLTLSCTAGRGPASEVQ